MGKVSEYQMVEVSKLKPYERNAKQHPQDQIEKIAESIKEFGFLNPILIDREFNIIAGHGRVEAVKLLGEETVPCLYVEGLTEAQRRAYILADNRLTELGGWDMEMVNAELTDLQAMDFDISLTGFDIEEFEPVTAEDDNYEEPENIIIRVNKGEVWQLGRHRLMCGDSTQPDEVEKLMGGVRQTC